MARRRNPYRVVAYEAIGFAVILIVTWLDEFLGFPEHYFTGIPHSPEWVEGGVETAAVLAVAIPTLLFTWRLIRRLFHLEGLLKVCAWCRKINDEDRWLPMEEYMSSELRLTTSHGMCPDCFEKAKRGWAAGRPHATSP